MPQLLVSHIVCALYIDKVDYTGGSGWKLHTLRNKYICDNKFSMDRLKNSEEFRR